MLCIALQYPLMRLWLEAVLQQLVIPLQFLVRTWALVEARSFEGFVLGRASINARCSNLTMT